jgi:predicted phosphohydrolase
MTLDREDIVAIAAEVVRQMRYTESVQMDMDYLASLPHEERKRILKAEFDRNRKPRKQSQAA